MISEINTKRILSLIVLSTFYWMTGCKPVNKNDRTWSVYKADENSSSYSPLDEINVSNVNQLQPAWTFKINDLPASAQPANSQSNPIIIDGVLYSLSAKRVAYAVNAATGQQIWMHDPFERGGGGGVERGVTYWESGADKRIFFAADNYLIAVDAKTGKPISSFGQNGKVNLNVGLRDNPENIAVTMTSPGIIYKDLIICGSRLPDLYGTPPGYIRAYHCKTGELVWTFHTIPLPGEAGYETWPKDAYKYAGGVNNWAGMAVDTKRGMVFMSLGSPTYDFYGADRIGENLYGNCILALDAASGKHVWHYQTVHHDIWDYDLPAPPSLVKLMKDGKEIDAVAQLSKQGFVFILNRETGEPLFPIEERPVPASNLPGEQAWPTQPFPVKPKAYARQSITEDDLTNNSPADHDSILKRFRSMRYEGLYTPPDLKGTLMVPGTRGGTNWGGGAFDPATKMLYIRSSNAPEIQTIIRQDPKIVVGMPLVDQGRRQYAIYCGACHGTNKAGIGTNPSLVDIEKRMTRETALDKIKKGGGQMPPYAGVLTEDQLDAILSYIHSIGSNSKGLAKVEGEGAQPVRDMFMNTTGYVTWRDPGGNPAVKPPWGTLHALNLSTGEYEWEIPLGNDEKRQAAGAEDTGLEGKSGPIVTAGGLIFIGGSEDKKFRAFEKSTGKLLWETTLPAMNNATACTYQANGKQYVAISVGGTKENPSGSIMAFALPGTK
jgi:quinoprotein glucose dehydrogenase